MEFKEGNDYQKYIENEDYQIVNTETQKDNSTFVESNELNNEKIIGYKSNSKKLGYIGLALLIFLLLLRIIPIVYSKNFNMIFWISLAISIIVLILLMIHEKRQPDILIKYNEVDLIIFSDEEIHIPLSKITEIKNEYYLTRHKVSENGDITIKTTDNYFYVENVANIDEVKTEILKLVFQREKSV